MKNIFFWHTFGPHAQETPEKIIARKKKEIEDNNGWTLWSFKKFSKESINHFVEIISPYDKVYVFCSDSTNAIDPAKHPSPCAKKYSDGKGATINDMVWYDVPKAVKVPHPFKKTDKMCCGFVVKKIFEQNEFSLEHNELIEKTKRYQWYHLGSRKWNSSPVNNRGLQYPNRSECLLSIGEDGVSLRPVKLILEIESPFVVFIKL